MRRPAAAMLVTLAALLGAAAWWSAPEPQLAVAQADPVAAPARPSIDLVLEYEPPVPRPGTAVRAVAVAPASAAPPPPAAAPTEYVPPERPDREPSPSEPPRAAPVSAGPRDAPALDEAEPPPGRAALVRRLIEIRERVAAGD